MRKSFLIIGLCVVTIFGCGESAKKAQIAPAKQVAPTEARDKLMETEANAPAPTVTGKIPESTTFAKTIIQQKIIRTAEVDIESSNLVGDLSKIESKVKDLGGYVARSTEDRRTEASKTAHLEVKIPAERLDNFLDFLEKGFQVEGISTNSEDITEEYVDISARLANSKNEEKRLLDLLENRTGKLDDVLMVERELARVRENVEVLEGRLRYYDNRVGLSTVTIEMRQYRPGEEVGTSWLHQIGNDIKDTFLTSIELLGRSIKALVLFLSGALPWLVILWLIIFIIRRMRRKRKRNK